MSAEAKFYRDHQGDGLGVGATPLQVFAREMLAPGKRYALVAEHLCLSRRMQVAVLRK